MTGRYLKSSVQYHKLAVKLMRLMALSDVFIN